VFGSKPVVFISDVGSDMDSGRSVRVSGLGSVLPSLHVCIQVVEVIFGLVGGRFVVLCYSVQIKSLIIVAHI